MCIWYYNRVRKHDRVMKVQMMMILIDWSQADTNKSTAIRSDVLRFLSLELYLGSTLESAKGEYGIHR